MRLSVPFRLFSQRARASSVSTSTPTVCPRCHPRLLHPTAHFAVRGTKLLDHIRSSPSPVQRTSCHPSQLEGRTPHRQQHLSVSVSVPPPSAYPWSCPSDAVSPEPASPATLRSCTSTWPGSRRLLPGICQSLPPYLPTSPCPCAARYPAPAAAPTPTWSKSSRLPQSLPTQHRISITLKTNAACLCCLLPSLCWPICAPQLWLPFSSEEHVFPLTSWPVSPTGPAWRLCLLWEPASSGRPDL